MCVDSGNIRRGFYFFLLNENKTDKSVQDKNDKEAVVKTPNTPSSKEVNTASVKEIQIDLKGIPIHVEGKEVNNGSDIEWSVVLDDGVVQRFRVNVKSGQMKDVTEQRNTESLPFFIKPSSEVIIQSEVPQPKSNIDMTPLKVQESEFVYVDQNGDVVFWNSGKEVKRIDINALPDSHILLDNENRILILTQPTNQYDHGIFGNQIEASGFAIIDTTKRELIQEAQVPKKDVIESLQPIWIDWDQNGTKEIILTVSNDESGARLVLYDETGNQLAEGEPIGQNHRWRHSLTVDAFQSEDRLELVEVVTPHIGGTLQFVEWDQNNEELKVVASGTEYSTHSIGSKNLNMYTTFDSNHDNKLELWLPNQSKNELIGVQRTAEGFDTIDKLSLHGIVSSNIVSVSNKNQSLLAVGTNKATLEIWMFTN